MRLLRGTAVFLPLVLCASVAAAGEVHIVRTGGDGLRIMAIRATAEELRAALEPHLGRPLHIGSISPVTIDHTGGDGRDLAWAVARSVGRVLAEGRDSYRVLRAEEATVTLDVQSMGSREVLREMARQCGVRNLALDPGLGNPAMTLSFEDVACRTAFEVVLRSSGWQAQSARGTMQVRTW